MRSLCGMGLCDKIPYAGYAFFFPPFFLYNIVTLFYRVLVFRCFSVAHVPIGIQVKRTIRSRLVGLGPRRISEAVLDLQNA